MYFLSIFSNFRFYTSRMIFARIGNGPCYYHWNEICLGVYSIFKANPFELSDGIKSKIVLNFIFLASCFLYLSKILKGLIVSSIICIFLNTKSKHCNTTVLTLMKGGLIKFSPDSMLLLPMECKILRSKDIKLFLHKCLAQGYKNR